MPKFLDPDSFGFLITDLSRLIRAEMDKRVAEAGLGLTPAEARTLAHAARAGAIRQNALAEKMGVEPMTLSGFIDRLEAMGLLRRSVDPADRRARLVELTPAGEVLLPRVRVIGAEIWADAARSIETDTWNETMEVLKTARANLTDARVATTRLARDDAA
jgi:MarR family transcriptional regulator for hemolysin